LKFLAFTVTIATFVLVELQNRTFKISQL